MESGWFADQTLRNKPMRPLFPTLSLLFAAPAWAAPFLVEPVTITDQKPVFATVESRHVEPARVRTGGTIASIAVKEGDWVKAGQVLAVVGDRKLVLQQAAITAQIAALTAQRDEARKDSDRARILYRTGAVSKVLMENADTALTVAINGLKAQNAALSVLQQQLAEGKVLAPSTGRVLKVDLTRGSVVEGGEEIVRIADDDLVLRLELPENYANFIKLGATVQLRGSNLSGTIPRVGTISLVYPPIHDGKVIAEAKLPGVDQYFVGERVRAMVGAGTRTGFVVPPDLISTSFGLDYAHVLQAGGTVIDVPVQPGQASPAGLEILSGLNPGDRLVAP